MALTTSGYIFTAKATGNRYKNALYISIILSLILTIFSVRKNNDITSIFSSFIALVITLQLGSFIHYLIQRNKKSCLTFNIFHKAQDVINYILFPSN